MTDTPNAAVSQRFEAIEGEVGSLKSEFKVLGNTVKGLVEDIAAYDRKQEAWHHETARRQEQFQKEWRDQKDAERREQDQLRQSRQLGPLQVLQIAGTGFTIMALAFGGFFFLIRAFVDGSITPQITQLTERQNSYSQSSIVRNEMMDNIRSDQAKLAATVEETERIANDNRDGAAALRERIRAIEIEQARQDERIRAMKPL